MREFWFGVFGSILGVLAGAALLIAAGVLTISAIAASWLEEAGFIAPEAASGADYVITIDLRTDELTAFEAVEVLHHAARDPRAHGVIVLTGGERGLSTAEGEALSQALTSVAQANRRTAGYLQDAEAAGLPAYLAVSAAEAVWASPFAVIRPEPAWSAPPQEHAIWARGADRTLQAVAEARNGSGGRIEARLNQGLVDAEAALEAGLVDQLGSAAAALAAARSGAEGPVIPAGQYLRSMRRPASEDHIALINLTGPVSSAVAAQVVTTLEASSRSPSVRGVIVQTDSAGGSIPAAFEIADAIARTQSAGTPVVALVGSAASGAGYFALAPAERIITPPAAALAGLGTPQSRLPEGLSARSGPAASDDPAARIADARYAAVLEGVARARDLPLARMDALSRGQIWSGEEAVAYGLADRIGGLDDAFEEVRSLAGVAADEPLGLQPSPPRERSARPLLERLPPAPVSP